jgi:hypothetical protein
MSSRCTFRPFATTVVMLSVGWMCRPTTKVRRLGDDSEMQNAMNMENILRSCICYAQCGSLCVFM